MIEILGTFKYVCSCKVSSVTCPNRFSLFWLVFSFRGDAGVPGARSGVCIDYGSK